MEFKSTEILENEPSTSAFALACENTTEASDENLMAFDADNTDANGANDQPTPEFLQRKLYFLLENLKTMHSELPEWVSKTTDPSYQWTKLK